MKKQLLIIGIVVMVIVGTASFVFYKQKEQETAKILSLKKEIEELSIERINIAKEIKEINDETQRLREEAEIYSEKKKKLDSDILMARKVKEGLFKEVSEKEQLLSGLNDKLNSIVQQEADLTSQLEKAKSDCQKVVQKIEATRNEKQALEENIKTHISVGKAVELKKIVVKVTPPLEGKVVEVNKEYKFVIIGLGLKDNIKNGDVFGIYRNDQLIAKAVAENIYEEMSSIIILDEWSGAQVLTNDTVRLLKP